MWVTQGSPFQCERRDRLVALSGRTKDRAELQHPRKGETHPRHTPLPHWSLSTLLKRLATVKKLKQPYDSALKE